VVRVLPTHICCCCSSLFWGEQRRAGQGEAGVEVALEGRAGQGEAGVEVAGFPTTKDVRRLTWGSRFGLYRWLRAFGATGWLAR
jgi:hypothetical protein